MFGLIGILSFLKSIFIDDIFLSNLLMIPGFFILVKLWEEARKEPQKIATLIFSIILTFIFIVGGQLASRNSILINPVFVSALLFTPFVLYPAVSTIKTIFIKFFSGDNKFLLKPFHKAIIFGSLLIATSALWVINFPGIFTYDMAIQNKMIASGTITSHWSLTYGLYLRFFIDYVGGVLHNYNLGFALAMFLQILICVFAYYKLIVYIALYTKNKKITIVSLLFFLLNPFLMVLPFTAAQDSLFSALIILFLIQAHQLLFFEESIKFKKLSIIAAIATVVALITLRNNAIYCFILCVPFCLAFLKASNRRLTITILSVAISLGLILTGPIYKMIGVSSNTTLNEVLSVPSQQLAKVFIEKPDKLSSEDKKELGRFYNIDKGFYLYANYPQIADYTKDRLRSSYTKKHLGRYFTLWLRLGLSHPKQYFEAFALNSLGFWLPYKNYITDNRINLSYMNYPGFIAVPSSLIEERGIKNITRVFDSSHITHTSDAVIFDNLWFYIPIISFLSSMGCIFCLILFALILMLSQKKTRELLVILPVIIYGATLLLAPVAVYRYVFPVIVSVPFILFVSLSPLKLYRGRNDSL